MRFTRTAVALICLFVLLAGCTRRTDRTASNTTVVADAKPTPTPDNTGLPEAHDAAGYVALGNELYRRDRDEEAVKAYQRALELDPEYAEAYLKLGLTYRVLGQKKESDEAYDKAVKAFEKAVRADGEDARAQTNLAEAYSLTSEYQKAVDAYKRAMKLRDPDSVTYFNLGEAYTKLARYKEAMDAYQHALDLDPDFFRASEALERARNGKDRVESARREYEKQLEKQRALNANQNGNQNSNKTNANRPPANSNHTQ